MVLLGGFGWFEVVYRICVLSLVCVFMLVMWSTCSCLSLAVDKGHSNTNNRCYYARWDRVHPPFNHSYPHF